MKGFFYTFVVFILFALIGILLIDISQTNSSFYSSLTIYKELEYYTNQINNILFYSKNNLIKDALSDYTVKVLDNLTLEDQRYFIADVVETPTKISKHIKLKDGSYIDCYNVLNLNTNATKQVICFGPYGVSKEFKVIYNDNQKIKNLLSNYNFTVVSITKNSVPITAASDISRSTYHPNYNQLLNESYVYPFGAFGGITGVSLNKYKNNEIYPLERFHDGFEPSLQPIINKKLCEKLNNLSALKNLLEQYLDKVVSQISKNNKIKIKVISVDVYSNNNTCIPTKKINKTYKICVQYEISKSDKKLTVKRCGLYSIKNSLLFYDDPIYISRKLIYTKTNSQLIDANYIRSNYEYKNNDCIIKCNDIIGYIKYTKERIFYDKITICNDKNINCINLVYHISTEPYEITKVYSLCGLIKKYLAKNNNYCDGVEKYVISYYKSNNFNEKYINYIKKYNISRYYTLVYITLSITSPNIYLPNYVLQYRYGEWK